MQNKVIIVDASKEYKEGKNQNELTETHVKTIVTAYDHFALNQTVETPVAESFARLIEAGEIAGNDYNLNISRYVDTSIKADEIDLHKVKDNLLELEAKEKEIDERLLAYLTELGI